MKLNLILLFFLIFNCVVAQDENDKIIYLDSLNREASKENHHYYKIIKDYNLQKTEYKFLKHLKSGILYQEGFTLSKDGPDKLVGEIIFYHKNGNKNNSTFFENERPLGKVEKWYENGAKSEEGEFIDVEWATGKAYKIHQFWDENNTHKVIDGNGIYTKSDAYTTETGTIKNGYKDGVWNGQTTKNTYSYVETYKDGDLISGSSTDLDGTKYTYSTLEVRPEPKKGIQHFYDFISKNFTYTRASIREKTKGKVIIQFVVDTDGKIVEPKIIKGLGYGLDEEAIRVLLSYDKWIPALQRGRKVRCSYSIPLSLSTE